MRRKEAGAAELPSWGKKKKINNQAWVPKPDPRPRTMQAGPAIVRGRQKGFVANILLAEIHQVGGSLTGIESSKRPSALTGADSRAAGSVGP